MLYMTSWKDSPISWMLYLPIIQPPSGGVGCWVIGPGRFTAARPCEKFPSCEAVAGHGLAERFLGSLWCRTSSFGLNTNQTMDSWPFFGRQTPETIKKPKIFAKTKGIPSFLGQGRVVHQVVMGLVASLFCGHGCHWEKNCCFPPCNILSLDLPENSQKTTLYFGKFQHNFCITAN